MCNMFILLNTQAGSLYCLILQLPQVSQINAINQRHAHATTKGICVQVLVWIFTLAYYLLDIYTMY